MHRSFVAVHGIGLMERHCCHAATQQRATTQAKGGDKKAESGNYQDIAVTL
jgi:hypothetical protein